ncbi:DUF5011 domain-containing protein [Porticoccaceae bacterium]|nr:DUF5011 domain-containing protein [Porticoccaceae bacterium]
MNRLQSLFPLFILVFLTACGGGGGSSAPENPVQPPADTTAPVITLNGDNPQEVELNAEYVEAGASTDTGETVVIDSSAVDTSTVGSYTVTYNAADAAGNQAVEQTRAVNVVDNGSGDTTAPVITLNGDNPQTIELNEAYQEAGATTDTGEQVDIDSSAVDTSAVASYEVIYTATDAAGNAATPVVRTVNVVDSSAAATKLSVLTSIVDQIVIPNYKALSDEAAAFAAADGPVAAYCDALETDTEATALADAQDAWKSVMHEVQKTELHIIGPAAKNNSSLRNRVYFYQEKDNSVDTLSSCATDAAVVNANSQSDFQVSATPNNQRSLSSIEYLLFNTNLDHTCSSNVPAVADWNALSAVDRKAQRCVLAELIAEDVAVNAEQIHSDWGSYRESFLNPDEIGTTFELMTDGLFYFEKHTKSAKLNGPLGIDAVCPDDKLTCPEYIESPYSETSLENIKVNAEQFIEIFSTGLDELADETAPGSWSNTFKELINDVIDRINTIQASNPDDSLSDQVASITSTNDMAACESAFGSPDTESELPICSLGGLVKRVTDDLKIEFITYLGVDLPEGAGGDTD